MPTPSELLRRFRLMAVPGRAAVAAVPADRREALRMELEPVFAALRASNEGSAATVARAEAEGQALRTRAAEEASEIVASHAVRDRSGPRLRRSCWLAQPTSVEISWRPPVDVPRRSATVPNTACGPRWIELVRRVLAIGTTAGSNS